MNEYIRPNVVEPTIHHAPATDDGLLHLKQQLEMRMEMEPPQFPTEAPLWEHLPELGAIATRMVNNLDRMFPVGYRDPMLEVKPQQTVFINMQTGGGKEQCIDTLFQGVTIYRDSERERSPEEEAYLTNAHFRLYSNNQMVEIRMTHFGLSREDISRENQGERVLLGKILDWYGFQPGIKIGSLHLDRLKQLLDLNQRMIALEERIGRPLEFGIGFVSSGHWKGKQDGEISGSTNPGQFEYADVDTTNRKLMLIHNLNRRPDIIFQETIIDGYLKPPDEYTWPSRQEMGRYAQLYGWAFGRELMISRLQRQWAHPDHYPVVIGWGIPALKLMKETLKMRKGIQDATTTEEMETAAKANRTVLGGVTSQAELTQSYGGEPAWEQVENGIGGKVMSLKKRIIRNLQAKGKTVRNFKQKNIREDWLLRRVVLREMLEIVAEDDLGISLQNPNLIVFENGYLDADVLRPYDRDRFKRYALVDEYGDPIIPGEGEIPKPKPTV